jgi:hypothetical protein
MITRRGVIVRNIAIALAVIGVWVLAERITTPEHCQVPAEQLSHSCADMLFPN